MRQALDQRERRPVRRKPPLRHAHHRQRHRGPGPARQLHRPGIANIPVLVTTSRLLSTGVDAQTCRLIVLDRAVGSMTEFKQIVGRGTRVHEDTKKFYFTLIDFRGATSHFADPDFDGEPVQIYEPGEDDPIVPPDDAPPTGDDEDPLPPEPGEDETIVDGEPPDITIAARRPRKRRESLCRWRRRHASSPSASSISTRTASSSPRPSATSPRRPSRSASPASTTSSSAGSAAERKQAIIDELAAEGLPLEPLAEEVGKDLDPFDLICHVAFDQPPLTRRERAENVRKRDVFTKYGPQARAVLEALLQKYQDEGMLNLDDPRFFRSRRSTPWARRSNSSRRSAHAATLSSRARTPDPPSIRKPLRPCPFATLVKSIQDIMRQDVGRRWRRPAHQPALLDVLPQDHRRPGPGTGTARARLPLARSPKSSSGAPGPPTRRASPARRCWPSSTTSSSRRSRNFPLAGKQGDRRRVVRDVFEDAYNYMKSGQLMRQVINKINEVDFNNLAERQHFGDIYEQILNDLQSAGNAGEYYTPRAVTAFMADRIDPQPGEILLDPACGTGGFLTCAMRHMREHYVKKRRRRAARCRRPCARWRRSSFPTCSASPTCCCTASRTPASSATTTRWPGPTSATAQADRVDIVLTNPPFGGREEDGIEINFPKHFQTRETADLFLALIIRLLKPGGRAAVVLPDGSLFGEGVKTRLKEHLMEECNLHTIVRLPNSVFKPYASIGTNLLFFEKGEPTKDIWFYEHRVPDGQKAYSMTKPIRVEHLQPCVELVGRGEAQGPQGDARSPGRSSAEEVKARGYNLDFKNPHTVADDHGDPEELLAKLDAAEKESGRACATS